jgi:hypothetical protein
MESEVAPTKVLFPCEQTGISVDWKWKRIIQQLLRLMCNASFARFFDATFSAQAHLIAEFDKGSGKQLHLCLDAPNVWCKSWAGNENLHEFALMVEL